MKKIVIISILIFQVGQVCGQKVKVKQDSVAAQCPDIPREKRPRVTVPRFNATAPNAPQDQFGDNLATMLTNALQQVNCYNVLGSLKDTSDLLDQQKFQQQHGSKSHRIKTSNFTNPNVIIVGEIIKYEVSSKSVGIALVHSQKSTALIGINIILKDAETNEVIDSRQFNAEKKVQGGLNVGVKVPLLGRIDGVSTAMQNPAVQQATENAINQAVIYISSQRDRIKIPDGSGGAAGMQTTFIIQNLKYEQVAALTSTIEKIPGVVSVDSDDDFTDNTATIPVNHTIKQSDLISKVTSAKTGIKLSVKSKSGDTVTLSAN